MLNPKYRVYKFGGTSVGAPERIVRVTDIIAMGNDLGPLAVVVSAMGKTTDWLLEAIDAAAGGDYESAEQLCDRISDLAITNALVAMQMLEQQHGVPAEREELTPVIRELLAPLPKILYGVSLLRERTAQSTDLILSFGERTSATVLAALCRARGIEAVFVDSRTWTVTDDTFGTAVVDLDACRQRVKQLRPGWGQAVPINTGFLGRTPDGRTTTLGRNGSDYTATLLARCLDAEEVCVWTDVSGVMTADPRIVDDAYPLARLSYMEAVELANFGARMFHPRTMIPLIDSGIPMRIGNTMRPEAPGTLIDARGAQDASSPTSVTSMEQMALVDIEWRRLSQRAKVGERVLAALDRADVPVWMAAQGAHGQSVAVVVPWTRVDDAKRAIHAELALELDRHEANPVTVRAPVTLLSLVCETMGQTPNVAGRFFNALGQVGVNIHAIAQGASSRSIACVVDDKHTLIAVRTVHAAFHLAKEVVNLVIMGKGNVAGHLIGQIRDQQEILERDHSVSLRVVAIADSERYVFDPRGVALGEWRERLQEGEAYDLAALIDKASLLPVPVLVDCTAAGGFEDIYRRAFDGGLHVVAANKKPLTVAAPEHRRLMAEAKLRHRAYHYETTVGASLPVIETLKNLVRTGDRVHLIEGSLSGTLGYLTNEVMAGVPLSKAVRVARELGYTEPQPQEDLSGMDVARKALILARELGLTMSLDDVAVEPLVPQELLDEPDIDAFFGLLEKHDEAFSAEIEKLKVEGRTLRYLARIDPEGDDGKPQVRVGPIGVGAGHPATHLRGSEAFVAFTTERYHDYPHIVQGPGAGGAVTAAGVLADILKVAQTLRGK